MYLLFFILAVLIGASDAVITKRFAIQTIDTTTLVTGRFIVASLCLLPFAMHDLPVLRQFKKKDWWQTLFLALGGTILVNLLYFKALTLIPAFMTLMLYRLEPIFIILIAALFLKQKTSARTWALTVTAIFCSALIAVGNAQWSEFTSGTLSGIALILFASLLFAASTIIGKDMLNKVSPILLIWLRMAIAAVILASVQAPALYKTIPTLRNQDLIILFILGMFHSGLANWFFYKGLQASSPLFAGLIQLLGPVSGLTLSFLLLGEQPTLMQFVGICGLILVLYLLASPEKSPVPAATPESV